jgi:hypothetical protein
MNAKQTRDLISWLKARLNEADMKIKESQIVHNYGRATQYEGMKEAYLETLRKLNVNMI